MTERLNHQVILRLDRNTVDRLDRFSDAVEIPKAILLRAFVSKTLEEVENDPGNFVLTFKKESKKK